MPIEKEENMSMLTVINNIYQNGWWDRGNVVLQNLSGLHFPQDVWAF